MNSIMYLILILGICCVNVGESARYQPHRLDVHIVPHALDLDIVTFDKVLNKFNVTLVMFMDFMTLGEKLIEFKSFAESTITQPEVVAATVAVTDEGEMNNWGLAERFHIKKEQLPVIKLFVGGKEAGRYNGRITCDNLRLHIKEETGLWVGKVGNLEYLDNMAETFIKAHSDTQREKLREKAINYREKNLTRDDDIESASYYIKVMEEYIRRGLSFLTLEADRIKVLKARHRFHKDRLCSLDKQKNILQSFEMVKTHAPHDEL